MSATDALATVGVALLLLAFLGQQRGWMGDRSPGYLLLNLVGAVLAGLAAWMGGILPFVVLEAVWAGVALAGLLDIARRRTGPCP